MNNFDRVAPVYDRIASIVFGRKWQEVQLAPTKMLHSQSEILIVGGGTGRLLEGIPEDKNVTFVELSSQMISGAKRREIKPTVEFVNANYLQWRTHQQYDAIVFPFFLDCFSSSDLGLIIEKAKSELAINGTLYVLDFVHGKWYQNFLVKVMHWFFKLCAGLEAKRLQNFDQVIQVAGFSAQSKSWFMNRWVYLGIYKIR